MAYLRVLGDCHQEYKEYLKLVEDCEYTIQVGDLGYNVEPLHGKLRSNRDFVVNGNHEDYNKESPNYCMGQSWSLGDYGVLNIPDFEPIFYMRGEWSIDWKWRLRNQTWPQSGPTTWFEEEELSPADLEKAIALYSKVKPNFVVTHGCPKSIIKYVTDPNFCLNFGYTQEDINTRTSLALEEMLQIHQPRYFVFGHYHTYFNQVINGTNFICLDMLHTRKSNKNSYMDFPKYHGIHEVI